MTAPNVIAGSPPERLSERARHGATGMLELVHANAALLIAVGIFTAYIPPMMRSLWVDETRRARKAGLDLDHAAAMVAERTRQRYLVLAVDADPDIAAKYERISATQANVAGIMRWLDKAEAVT